ncbi:pleckstrin homology-like domain family B member 1 [Paramacrobiotus metropolitanus]|uniref:pleckstrin homology-like domain family B member 1 n=1 Tax=Paramacrobiotus metropolitanus TaxID=2943436 RepID=UPI00244577FD|nr:pleckstrin homology-like domain family B member 1 [Paramacrobiotus metropolitanus]XP_055333471.1 pleckstrin homology-like domain family B member 1 [Paramacrobiotus metropolitanus]
MSTMFVKFDKKEKKPRKNANLTHAASKDRSRSSSVASLDVHAIPKNHSRVSLSHIHSSEFNLRGYLESTGVNVDASKSYVRVEDSTIRGYLQKLSHRWKVWNRRWFVLDWRAGTLIYYKTNKEHGSAQVIPFRHIMGVSTDSSSRSEPKFCLKTTQKSYVLMAPTAEVLRIWLDFLMLVIDNKDK